MESLTFEEAFALLEATVAALQNGQMPLERALECYQEGMKLAQHCNELLQNAELVVEQLHSEANGTISALPLEVE